MLPFFAVRIASIPTMQSKERLMQEFTEIGNSIRHYSALRFAILTLFFAFAGGTISFVYGEHPPSEVLAKVGTQIAGIVGSLVLWFFEYRLQEEFLHLERRSAQIEQQLEYNVYKRRTLLRIRMFWLTSLLYGGVVLFWCLSFA